MAPTISRGQTLLSAHWRNTRPVMSVWAKRCAALLMVLSSALLLATLSHAERLPSDWMERLCSPLSARLTPTSPLRLSDLATIQLPNNWKPRPYQLPAWEYLEGGGKHLELVWHRRGGKDDLALHWTAVASNDVGNSQSIGRVGNYWHMLPQANQARKAIWEAVNPHTGKRRVDEAFPKEIRAATQEHEMLIRFICGSTWQVVGSDNFNSLVGSPPVGLVFSEWPLCDPAAWAYLMPILEENGGWAIFNGTPRGKNHAHKSLASAKKTPGMLGESLTAHDTDVFTTDQLERIRQQLIDTYGQDYGQAVFDQEYMVSFDAANLGAILGRALVRAEQEGRISDAIGAYDYRGAPVEISSDIGRRDASTWWFWQPCLGGYRVVNYDKDSGLDADEWCDRLVKRLTDNGYRLGHVWLPHDAKAKTFSAKHSAVEIFLQHFGSDKVRIVPNSTKTDRINAARRVVSRCAFHATNTEKGRDGLSSWAYVYDEERREFSKEPDHNWASHDGDGYSYGAQVMEELVPEVKKENVAVQGVTELPGGGISLGVSLDTLWKQQPRKVERV